MVMAFQSHHAVAWRPVTLIHGPPGTGKTRTAAVVALTFASQNAQSSAKTSDEAIQNTTRNRTWLYLDV